jgi:hypothetical protein
MLRCPRDISPYCEGILNLALEYVSYDPNFTDSMEEDTDDEVQDEEDDEYVIYSCNTKTLAPIIIVTSLTFSQ